MISPELIGRSNELKFTAWASSSLSVIHAYLLVATCFSLFLTGPSISTQFENAAVLLELLVVSLNSIWSTWLVFPLVETYLYLILNWITSCEISSPILLGSGIG